MFYDLLIIGNDKTARRVAHATVSNQRSVGLVECPWQWEDEFWLDESCRVVIQPDAPPMTLRNRLVQGVNEVRQTQIEQLTDAGVDVWRGKPRFLDQHTVMVARPNDPVVLSANQFLIASGTRPQFPRSFLRHRPFAMTPGELFEAPERHQSLVMLAHSRVEMRQASLLARWGIPLQLCPMTTDVATSARTIDSETEFLNVNDQQELASLIVDREQGEVVLTFRSKLANGELKKTGLLANRVCVSGVRYGCTNFLNLSVAGIRPDEHRRIWCHPNLQTWTPHIFASGEVVGYPPELTDRNHTDQIIEAILQEETKMTSPEMRSLAAS